QTMATAMRFSTAELSRLEAEIAGAGERAKAIELALFEDFVERARAEARLVRAAAAALAELDADAGLAEWAVEARAVRPTVEDSGVFDIEAGRHPVVEAARRRDNEPFTPNHCRLDADGEAGPRLVLVTGPNMAGKSTYLRQNALIAILAQAGSFVPAASARIGAADRVFSRVGAADDLARGRSTFMAEMLETAAILNQAGPRALVILDEIGRGTATFDGLAIAWAAAEHIYETNACRALFATHYHELTRLADQLPKGANVSLKAKEWKGALVFLHEVGPGPADRSYGVEVARRAGLPRNVVARARAVLAKLEAHGGAAGDVLADLPLFAAAPRPSAEPPAEEPDVHRVLARLDEIDPDELSPRAALAALFELKALAESETEPA
ncbi:MAG: DNA mismatch repair protein MutS, partial [Caulobacterales bacterium]|nr:DNA mismatch repair protein MutS [Caulobacterales bacterium]